MESINTQDFEPKGGVGSRSCVLFFMPFLFSASAEGGRERYFVGKEIVDYVSSDKKSATIFKEESFQADPVFLRGLGSVRGGVDWYQQKRLHMIM